MAKDILTTHSVYWPTMLMAAKISLPETIFSHGWWLMEETKMSKSLGNIVNPMELIDEYGVDSVRYYLMRDMVLGMDANFTLESFIKRYNSDLANDYGNLVNRVLVLIDKYFNGKIPKSSEFDNNDLDLIAKAKELPIQIIENYNNFKLHDGIELNIKLFRLINKYLEIKSPWKTIKTNKTNTGTTLYVAIEVLRIGTILINPIMPNKSSQILECIGAEKNKNYTFGSLNANTPSKISKYIRLFITNCTSFW